MDEASFRCEDCNAELLIGKWYGLPFEKPLPVSEGRMLHAWLTVHEYHRLRFGRPSDDPHNVAFPDVVPTTYHSNREGTEAEKTPPVIDGGNRRLNLSYPHKGEPRP